MLNCNVAWRYQLSLITVVVVVSNGDRKVVHEIAKEVWCSSALVKEAQAILSKITLTTTLSFSSVVCAFDSDILCDALSRGHSELLWSIHVIVIAILVVSSHLQYISFRYISKQANHLADELQSFDSKTWYLMIGIHMPILSYYNMFALTGNHKMQCLCFKPKIKSYLTIVNV